MSFGCGGSTRMTDTIFSPCRTYRYALWREWIGGDGYVMFIGLNPSTADETQDDPTIRRCIAFAKAWGYGGLSMTNLFAFRATDPKKMKAVADPIGPENDAHLLRLARDAGVIVAAWGANGTHRGRDADVRELLKDHQRPWSNRHWWHLMVAFPPCTHLAVSGARWFKNKLHEQQQAIEFVRQLLDAPIDRIALENPIGILSTRVRKPDQIIQPWQFGHGETKATCLWLKNLPPLRPTKIVSGREPRVHHASPGPDRWKERSRTLPGIANAMAEQWGAL